jgi:hypothetical protein
VWARPFDNLGLAQATNALAPGLAPTTNNDPGTFIGRLLMQQRDEGVRVSPELEAKLRQDSSTYPCGPAAFRALCEGKHTLSHRFGSSRLLLDKIQGPSFMIGALAANPFFQMLCYLWLLRCELRQSPVSR